MSTYSVIRTPRLFPFSRRIFIGATVSVVSLVLAVVLFYKVYAQTLPAEDSASSVESVPLGTVYLSDSGQTAARVAPTEEATMREVHIANNGLMLLRGATVISNVRGTIRVSMEWGSADFTWEVKTDSDTRFVTSKGEKGTLADIQTGNSITVTGQLTGSGAEPTIEANFVRE